MANIVDLVLGYQIETAILVIVGLLLGVLISMFYWKGQVYKRDAQIKELETTVEEKDAALGEMRTRSQELLSEKTQKIEDLTTQLKDTKKTLKDREKEIEKLNAQVTQRDETISEQNLQIGLKDESIELMKKEAAELEQMNRDTVSRAEEAEAKGEELEKTIETLENSLEAKTGEAESLKTRIRYMQDDFSNIAGIGPKVSAVLRSAGINTYAKLATADVDRLTEILEKENPSLLRLTDPATWPEQAKLASEEDWEALSALQESLKEKRRSQASTQ